MIRELIERIQAWRERRDAQRRRRARELRLAELQQQLHALHVIGATPARNGQRPVARYARHG